MSDKVTAFNVTPAALIGPVVEVIAGTTIEPEGTAFDIFIQISFLSELLKAVGQFANEAIGRTTVPVLITKLSIIAYLLGLTAENANDVCVVKVDNPIIEA